MGQHHMYILCVYLSWNNLLILNGFYNDVIINVDFYSIGSFFLSFGFIDGYQFIGRFSKS